MNINLKMSKEMFELEVFNIFWEMELEVTIYPEEKINDEYLRILKGSTQTTKIYYKKYYDNELQDDMYIISRIVEVTC